MALSNFAATELDKALLKITGFSVTVFSIADVVVACISIATWITSCKFLGNGMAVLLTSLSLGDLLLAPGGLAIVPILGGWETLDKQMIQMTMGLRDMPLIVLSVFQPLTIALICIQFYLHNTGNTRLSSAKISVGLAILAWLYAVLLVGAIVLYYGMASDDTMSLIAVLRLPLTWLPAEFLQAWHILNVFVWLIVAIIFLILCFTRSTNAVQPLNDPPSSDSSGNSSPRILVVQVVITALTWLPYSLYTGLVTIGFMTFTFKWIHIYDFFYVLALICSVLRPLITIMLAPELKKKVMEVIKCKCL